MATDGFDYSTLLESSILCSKEYITDQHITLPHGKDGKIDYSTLGNILTAKLLEENLYLSYVDKMYGDPDKASLLPDLEGWKFFSEEKQVQLFRKCYANFPLHAFAGRCVIDVPMQRIAKVIANLNNRFHYDLLLQEIRDAVTLSAEDYISYIRHEAKRCLFTAKRDFCFYERRAFKGGKYVQALMSVDHPSCPLVEGVIRAKLHPGTGWILEPYRGDPTRTLATFICHVDLCGMPNLIINRVLRREPIGLAYLRKYIMSLDSPPIALPALSQMTLNFDASLSSSIVHDTSSLPATPTCTYVRSPDLLMNKAKTNTSSGDDHFHSIPRTSESQSTLDDSAKHNPVTLQQDNTSNHSNNDQSTEQTQVHQQNGLVKSEQYAKKLAGRSVFDSSVTSSNMSRMGFTLSTSSEISGLHSGIIKDTSTVGTVSSTGYQPSLDESSSYGNNSALHSQSVEVPQLPSGQFDMFVSL